MFILTSAAETVAAGRERGLAARAGDVLALSGDLGAGKTQFVKGVVAGAGSMAEVTSPTFTVIHEYGDGRLPIYHFDFYRIESAEDALRIGLDDYLFGDGLCVIEWADRFPALMPKNVVWLHFEIRSETERAIEERRPT